MDEVRTPMRKIQQLVSIWKEKNTLMNQPPFWENKQTGMVGKGKQLQHPAANDTWKPATYPIC